MKTVPIFTPKQLADFARYVRLQRGGAYNMLDPRARMATGLSSDEYCFVMDNYEALEAAQLKAEEMK